MLPESLGHANAFIGVAPLLAVETHTKHAEGVPLPFCDAFGENSVLLRLSAAALLLLALHFANNVGEGGLVSDTNNQRACE